MIGRVRRLPEAWFATILAVALAGGAAALPLQGVGAGPCPVLGLPAGTTGGLAAPVAVAFLPDGSLVVADPAAKVIRRIGVDRERWSDLAGPSEWVRPVAVATSAGGDLFVADAGTGRIERFDAAGLWRSTAIADAGSALGAIAVGSDRIAVVEPDLDRLRIFTLEGVEIARVGAAGPDGPRVWRRPAGVAIAGDGRIFVSDGDGHRIVVLEADGTLRGAFGDRGPFPGLLQEPSGLAIAEGCLFVADRLNHRVGIFSLEGRFLGQWGLHATRPRSGDGELHYPVAVAISPDRMHAVVAEPFERRVQWFERDPDPTAALAALPPPRDGVSSHFGPHLAIDGALLALWEPESAAVVLFDWRRALPIHVTTFGHPTSKRSRLPDRFGRIGALALDAARQRLAIADAGEQRLAFFDLDRDPQGPVRFDPFMARLAGTVEFDRLADGLATLRGDTDEPRPIEPVDALWWSSQSLLLLDRNRGVLLVIAAPPSPRPDGHPLPQEVVGAWGDRGTLGGRFPAAVALARSPAGREVAVLDRHLGIVRLDGDGVVGGTIALPASAEGGPLDPAGLAWLDLDGESIFVVSDAQGDRLCLVDAEGALRGRVGGCGEADGELWSPRAVRPIGERRVVVVDRGNHRGQAFEIAPQRDGGASGGRWETTFGLGRAYSRPRGVIDP